MGNEGGGGGGDDYSEYSKTSHVMYSVITA